MATKDSYRVCSLLFLLLIVFSTYAIENSKIARNVKLNGANFEQHTSIEFINDSDRDISEYILLVHKDFINGLVFIGVESGKEPINVTRDDTIEIPSDKYVPFLVDIGNLRGGQDMRIMVREIYANRKAPFPSTMKLTETPKLRVIDDAYYPTVYKTRKMKSSFECDQCNTVKATKMENGEVRGKIVRYGNFKNVEALKSHTVYIQLTFDAAQPIFTSASREITLSHWSSISVEEEYRLINNLPKVSNGFGRIDYNPYNIKYALTNMYCELPVETTDLSYTDEIGNITTSRAYRDFESVKFSIEPRFPLVGGWKTYWKQNYDLPQESYIKPTGNPDEYEFNINFSHPFDDIVAEEFEFSIILPEGATDTKIDIPFEMDNIKHATVFKYLDLFGRQKIIMSKRNILEQVHDKTVRVTYKLSKNSHYLKPAILIFYLFVLLFVLQQLWKCSSDTTSKVKTQ